MWPRFTDSSSPCTTSSPKPPGDPLSTRRSLGTHPVDARAGPRPKRPCACRQYSNSSLRLEVSLRGGVSDSDWRLDLSQVWGQIVSDKCCTHSNKERTCECRGPFHSQWSPPDACADRTHRQGSSRTDRRLAKTSQDPDWAAEERWHLQPGIHDSMNSATRITARRAWPSNASSSRPSLRPSQPRTISTPTSCSI